MKGWMVSSYFNIEWGNHSHSPDVTGVEHHSAVRALRRQLFFDEVFTFLQLFDMIDTYECQSCQKTYRHVDLTRLGNHLETRSLHERELVSKLCLYHSKDTTLFSLQQLRIINNPQNKKNKILQTLEIWNKNWKHWKRSASQAAFVERETSVSGLWPFIRTKFWQRLPVLQQWLFLSSQMPPDLLTSNVCCHQAPTDSNRNGSVLFSTLNWSGNSTISWETFFFKSPRYNVTLVDISQTWATPVNSFGGGVLGEK